VSENEYQSPLPPRQVNLGTTEVPATEESEAPVIDQISTRAEMTPPPVTPRVQFKKPGGKKILGLLILIFLIIAGVAGIRWYLGQNKNPITGGNETVTLNYWGLWEDSNLLESIFADFETQNPNIKVNYKRSQISDYRSRLQGRLAKSTTEEEVPDIFRIHSSWLPMFQGQLAAVPNDTVSTLEMDKDFYNVFKSDLMTGNKYMAIPLMVDSLELFYNKDIIESAGVALPKSWWDLQEIAKQLTVKDKDGKIMVAGLAAGMPENVDHWSDILGLLIKQNNGDLLLNTKENDANIRDAIIYFTNFKTLHKVWNESLPPSTEMFANGKLAFYFAPSWRVFDLEVMNPNLNYGIITAPQLPTLKDVPRDQAYASANLTNTFWATYWVEAVNQKSPNQKAAWKLLEFLASKEGLEKLYQSQSQIRSFGEIYPRISMADKIGDNPKIKPFISTANYAASGYLSSRTFDDGLNDQMSKYFTDAVNTLAASAADTDKAMTTLRSGIDQLILKYKLK